MKYACIFVLKKSRLLKVKEQSSQSNKKVNVKITSEDDYTESIL